MDLIYSYSNIINLQQMQSELFCIEFFLMLYDCLKSPFECKQVINEVLLKLQRTIFAFH